MKRRYISSETKAKMAERLRAGATYKEVAREFDCSKVTVGRVDGKYKSRSVKAQPSYVDIPVQSSSPKVMVIVTDAANIKTVVGELWK